MNTIMEDGQFILILFKRLYAQYQIMEIVSKLTEMVNLILFGTH